MAMQKPKTSDRVPSLGPGELQLEGVQTDDEVADEALSHRLEEMAITKRVVDRRKAQLVRRLKNRRGSKYARPRPGGEGKQSRTRRSRFS